jgi:hypothetical protein
MRVFLAASVRALDRSGHADVSAHLGDRRDTGRVSYDLAFRAELRVERAEPNGIYLDLITGSPWTASLLSMPPNGVGEPVATFSWTRAARP